MTTGERLIDAAAAVTLRAVGQAVGVSHNTPYRHFKDRAALLAGVAARDLVTFAAIFDEIGRSERPPIEQVREALKSLVTYGEDHPARYHLLFSDPSIGSRGGELELVAMTTFTALSRLVEQAQTSGQLPKLPTAMLTGLIFATVHGLLHFKAGGRMRPEKGLASVVDGADLLLRLLAPARK